MSIYHFYIISYYRTKMRKRIIKRKGDDEGLEDWDNYFAAKKSKLLEQFKVTVNQQVKKSDIFKDIAIFVNGLTKPNASELKILMAEHGGVFHSYQMSKTTHIIASNLPNVKVKHLGSVPIVKPSWVTDSLSLGKLLDYRRYLLYTNQSSLQPGLDFPVVEKQKPVEIGILDEETQNYTIKKVSNFVKASDKPQVRKDQTSSISKTASDPLFLEEFYNNSRLHLISTLGAEFKQLVTNLRYKSCGTFHGKDQLLQTKGNCSSKRVYNSIIMHIDMDCFFVSVGLRNRPELRGKPVAVTHARNGHLSNSRPEVETEFALYRERLPDSKVSRIHNLDTQSSMSEIASCSYEARKCGISNGMFLGTAVKLCPELRTMPYDFQDYRDVANILYNTVASYSLDIEAVSCDEMYVDVTHILNDTGLSVDDWATHIRTEIMEKTGCPCSTGFGANRLQARLATKKAKPAGQFYLQVDDVETYMSHISLADLPGVGSATLYKLKALGLSTCGDVQVAALSILQSELGTKSGETIMEQAKGIDRKPLNYHHERKSVSAEINYGIRFKTVEECHAFLLSLSEEVCKRLTDVGMRARCLTLKLMIRAAEAPVVTAKFLGHGVCDSLSKSTTSNAPIGDAKTIFREAKSLLEKMKAPHADLRGVGIQLSKLERITSSSNTLTNFLKQSTSTNNAVKCSTETQEEIKEYEKTDKDLTRNRENGKANSDVIDVTTTIGECADVSSKNAVSTSKTKDVPNARGRPKGHKNCVKAKPAAVNLYFKATHRNTSTSDSKMHLNSHNIDMEVLKELPEYLRKEIIAEYNLGSNDVDTPTPDNSGAEITSASTHGLQVRSGSNRNGNGSNGVSANSIKQSPFVNLNWDQIKPIIRAWMESVSDPAEIDIQMLAEHFKQWAVDKKIEVLQIVFNFLHRSLSKMSCNWHKAYFELVNTTQEGMVARYGGTLMVRRKFKCCK